MKKTKFYGTPEVHFTLSQEKRSEKKSNDKRTIHLSSTNRATQYMMHTMH